MNALGVYFIICVGKGDPVHVDVIAEVDLDGLGHGEGDNLHSNTWIFLLPLFWLEIVFLLELGFFFEFSYSLCFCWSMLILLELFLLELSCWSCF